jgi:hypothetical protein
VSPTWSPLAGPGVPTFAAYLPIVIAAAGPRRTYGSYWTRMETRWGGRCCPSFGVSM